MDKTKIGDDASDSEPFQSSGCSYIISDNLSSSSEEETGDGECRRSPSKQRKKRKVRGSDKVTTSPQSKRLKKDRGKWNACKNITQIHQQIQNYTCCVLYFASFL